MGFWKGIWEITKGVAEVIGAVVGAVIEFVVWAIGVVVEFITDVLTTVNDIVNDLLIPKGQGNKINVVNGEKVAAVMDVINKDRGANVFSLDDLNAMRNSVLAVPTDKEGNAMDGGRAIIAEEGLGDSVKQQMGNHSHFKIKV